MWLTQLIVSILVPTEGKAKGKPKKLENPKDENYSGCKIINFKRFISDWEIKNFTLVREFGNGTVVQTLEKGLLNVTIVNQKIGKERTGTVCGRSARLFLEQFNWLEANLFCRSISAASYGVWGTNYHYKWMSR
jgi:hypothetical protein